MRYKLILEYQGTQYRGWQYQPNQPTVQGALEKALLALTGESVAVVASGRTDTGVHALGQVVHCDIQKPFTPHALNRGLNFYLQKHSETLSVIESSVVEPHFHARFDTLSRQYIYYILNRSTPSTLWQNRAWHLHYPLAIQAMVEAVQPVIGVKLDYTSFRDIKCQALSPLRTLDSVIIQQESWHHSTLVTLQFKARSFLHKQVRSMVGTLVEIGIGKRPSTDFYTILQLKDRTACGEVAPPEGLYLQTITYKA